MRLLELQEDHLEVTKIKQNILEKRKNMEGILYYQSFLYIPKIICSEMISRYHNNLLASHFGI